jgi:hypothetical protein
VNKLAAPLTFGLLACMVYADKLHLRDGRILSGAVERQRDTYLLIDDLGNESSFHKDEVLRVIHESRVTLEELAVMLSRFELLIAPAFGLIHPQETRTNPLKIRGETGGPLNNPQQSEDDPLATERLVLKDSVSEFVKRWKSYAPAFEAIGSTMAFRNHTILKRGQPSLIEFAIQPPEGAEVLAESLKSFVELVKSTFDDAERAGRISIAIRETELRYDRQIRDAWARFPSTFKGRREAQHEVSRLKAMKESELQRMRASREVLINQIATNRVIAVHLLDETWQILHSMVNEQASAIPQMMAPSGEKGNS